MEEANRVCKELATTYWGCMDETRKKVLAGSLEGNCQDSFDDYTFCVKEVMRMKVEKAKANGGGGQ
jgi:hypothetical protein